LAFAALSLAVFGAIECIPDNKHLFQRLFRVGNLLIAKQVGLFTSVICITVFKFISQSQKKIMPVLGSPIPVLGMKVKEYEILGFIKINF